MPNISIFFCHLGVWGKFKDFLISSSQIQGLLISRVCEHCVCTLAATLIISLFQCGWKKSCISQITVWKLHVDAYVNNVSKRDISESLPVWLVKTENVGHWVPQYFMDITNVLTGHNQWRHYSSTGHSRIIPDHKEHFNLAITVTAFPLPVGYGIVVPTDHSFVHSGVECCSSNLEPWEKGYFRKWLYAQKCKEVLIKICISR